MKILKKAALYTLTALASYLVIGYLLHLVIFPEQKPEVSTYFKSGQVLYSQTEGFSQTVARQEDGKVYCNLEVHPYAAGPPKHIHTGFDEYFEIQNGELSVWVDGEVKTIRPGEVIHIPKGTPHKPFNQTADTIYLKKEFPMPEKFTFGINQIYALMDFHPNFGKMPAMLFMLAPLHQNGFDSYLAEGPPVALQKLTAFLLVPAARLLGYRSFYPEYDLHKETSDSVEKN